MSTPLIAAISALTPRIEGGGLITPRTLEEVLTSAYGAPASTGAWIWRTAYDALEGAAAKALSLGAPASLDALISAERRRPTQTRRSERQNRLQQFSTPLPYAAVAAHAAQLGAGDLVLEPSAGCGALAAAARTAGARLVLNEIDPQRREILASIFGAAPLGHDAAMIDDLLSPATSPSVVLMNPPFASSVASQDDPTIAARHLLSALKRLAPGGRLVAIMPMAFSPARQPALWRGFAARARIHMAMAVPGAVYARQGTTVTTQLIVADRIDDAGDDGCAFGPVADLESGDGPAALHALTRAVETHAPSRAPIVRAAPATARARTAAPASRRTAPAAPAPVRPAIQPLAYAVLAEPRVNQPVSDVYAAYRPQRVEIAGAQPHPTSLVESVAMASVAPPAPAAQPNLPLRLIERGGLSEAQLETAIYAREAHERLLSGRWIVSEDGREIDAAPEDAPEDGVRACRFRRGFFLGDGTGCGKGRQVASILLDNWLEGRRRALWVSKSDKLFEDACRDWSDVGGSPSDIKPLSRWKTDEPITAATAILFTTYATLRSVSQAGGRRLDQIVDWLTAGASDGDDAWGPVIAFDEAHAMGNAAGTKGSDRGASKPSQQGLAGLMLQAAIPAARVLYVSATGATTVENLAYASRLGLWGQHPDYPFPSRDAFLTAMNAGGVAAMEVVARDLKAMGVYIARSLSFEGVEYELIEHRLTGRQRALYDEWAGAFRIIHRNLGAALKATNLDDPDGGCNDARRKSAVMSRFESLKQRFFNHLVTGMKTPAAIEQIRADLAAGHSAVVQLVSTGEALLDRRLAQMNPDEMTDPIIDLTPREYVLDYLAQGFPTALMDVREDEGGNTYTTPVLDEAGAVAQSREAIAMRDAMIEKLALLDSVPAALDQLVWAFGPDAIAEATGRSKRPIVINDAAGRRLRIETRSAAANVSETRAFMDGAKRVLVFSEAGGTGRSYHAALTARNRQRRIHYLLEPGWKADAAVQGLGRSHRSAQASAPVFRVMSTDVMGEKRFVSTIARRLDTLGALTKGQRQTGGQGLFRAEDSLESPLAYKALRAFYRKIIRGQAETVSLEAFEELTALSLTAADGAPLEDMPPMPRFLNRILALEVDRQNEIFGEFAAILAGLAEIARERGALDIGVETIRAGSLTVVSRQTVHTDERTGAETDLVELERIDPVEVLTADAAFARHETARGIYIHDETGDPVFVHRALSETDDDGATIQRVKLYAPTGAMHMTREAFDNASWSPCGEGRFRAAWDERAAAAPREQASRFWMATGLLLPVWKHLPPDGQKIWRAICDDGAAVLGRVLSAADAGRFRAALAPTGIADAATLLAAVVEESRRVPLTQGATLALRRVGTGPRLEIGTPPADTLIMLKAAGCFTEIIQWKTRVFIPFDLDDSATSLPALERVLKILPIGSEALVDAA